MTDINTTDLQATAAPSLLDLTGAALAKKVEQLGKERTKIENRLNEIEAVLPALKAKADAEYAEQQAREEAAQRATALAKEMFDDEVPF